MVSVQKHVNHFLLWFLLVLTLSINVSVSAAAPELRLKLHSEHAELGRPIRAELYGIGLSENLSDINLDTWQKDFGLVNEYSSGISSDQQRTKGKTQILGFKLYPRNSGKLFLPPLSLGGVQTKFQTINVIKGKTSIPKIILSTTSPYERQMFNVTVQLTTTSSTARLSAQKQSVKNKLYQIERGFKRSRQEDGKYQLQISWAISTEENGEFQLPLPVIEYSESGVLRKLFFLEQPKLFIQPLPLYLPPTMTVGAVKVKSWITYNGWIKRTGSLYYWNITLQGNVTDSHQLPALLRQIKSDRNIKFLPGKSTPGVNIADGHFLSRVTHSIPFKVQSGGLQTLPILDIQYFDPDNGKIINIKHKAGSVFALNLFWYVVLYGLLILALILLFINIKRKWLHYRYLQNKNASAIEKLLKQKNLKDIREAIRLSAQAESWPRNITLKQWAGHWRKKYITTTEFENVTTLLSSAFYAKEETDDIKAVKNKISAEADMANRLAGIIKHKQKKKTLLARLF